VEGYVNGRWTQLAVSPYFTARANKGSSMTTWFNTSTGMMETGEWRQLVKAPGNLTAHYRVKAQIWWFADAYHSSGYASGVVEQRQWSTTYQGWVNKTIYPGYCSY
jgi:hypothetical protein